MPDDHVLDDRVPDDRLPAPPRPRPDRAVTALWSTRAAPARARWSWFVAVGLVVTGVGLTLDAQRDAADLRRAYGRSAGVWVVRRSVAAGAVLGPSDVRRLELPVALVPASAVAGADGVEGRTTVAPLEAGEVLLRHRLAGDAEDGVTALLPPGTLALTLPADVERPTVSPGDTVVLVLTDGAGLSGEGLGGDGLDDRGSATGKPGDVGGLITAVVAKVDGDDGALLVGVAAADAVRVAGAARRGTVTVALPVRQAPAPLRPRTGSTG